MIGSDENWAGSQVTADGNAAHQAITVRAADVHGKGDGRRGNERGPALPARPRRAPGRAAVPGNRHPHVRSGRGQAPTALVTLAARCHHPCRAPLNATELFRQLPQSKQTTARIPLSCFASQGLDSSNVDVLFLVHTTSAFEATFAQIH
ncbi:putative glycoside hydrolase [Lentzea sp. NBRC 102530]|uniref:putative glycoside hydrolase n=1 Tax=Lentzea sp. NBRC 102530 TaxID=3032201 RepID=UPI00332A1290